MQLGTGPERLYHTLCNVLDAIRCEAPADLGIYYPPPGNHEALIQARSRALLHLFLKARFGITSFSEREKNVTDGKFDGGIDAYYIDSSSKRIFLLQSKFRATPGNFTGANMSATDLLKIDVKRILKGEKRSEAGNEYNPKIRQLQKEIQKLPDSASYTPLVVLLGNTKNLTASELKKLVDGYEVEQIPHSVAYEELLFPVVSGTYFTSPDLKIEINLENIRSGDTHLDYNVRAAAIKANIKVLFVPTREVGRIMATYKNSILQFNPRSFLELKNNAVNREIQNTISSSHTGNEFSLFNNGITLIAENTVISSNTAKQGRAQVIVTKPQLVNGGQTAYTLSRIYERARVAGDFKVFNGKEVLLKIISFVQINSKEKIAARDKLILAISRASNSQTKVEEADRRSNDKIQLELQQRFFADYGLYYERKKGEFADGIHYGYIREAQIINREKLMRISLASSFRSAQAKSAVTKFFNEATFPGQLKLSAIKNYALGFEILAAIDRVRRTRIQGADRWKTKQFGHALRYGEYALLAVCINKGAGLRKTSDEIVAAILRQWTAFEAFAVARRKNAAYVEEGRLDAISYYKGSTIDTDLKAFRFKI